MGLMGASPVVIVGMHRSGTSLTAAFLEALGVDLGGNLLAADCHNAKGYFEDVDFLEFQRQLLQGRSRSDDGGWPDWGWTEGEGLDLTDLEGEYGAAARGLIEARPGDRLWGWKDPRTSLLLEFWDRLLPNAVYLMVYRLPWDVADSVLRIGHPTFVERPEYGLRAWHFYNRRLLDFYERRRDRCVLFNVNGLLAQPERLADLVEAKLGLRVAGDRRTLGSVFDPALFGQLGWRDPLPQALRQVAPAYWGLLDELDRAADLPSDREGVPFLEGVGPLPSYGDQNPPAERSVLALHYRTLATNLRLGEQVRSLEAEVDRLQQSEARLASALATARQQLVEFRRSKAGRLWRIWQRVKRR